MLPLYSLYAIPWKTYGEASSEAFISDFGGVMLGKAILDGTCAPKLFSVPIPPTPSPLYITTAE